MSGVDDLPTLLATLSPQLDDAAYTFVSLAASEAGARADEAFAVVREAEGVTLIAATAKTDCATAELYARITLAVHSSLTAVGLTARVSQALAELDIPANMIAGFFHDHVFVPYERRHEALAALAALSVTKVQ